MSKSGRNKRDKEGSLGSCAPLKNFLQGFTTPCKWCPAEESHYEGRLGRVGVILAVSYLQIASSGNQHQLSFIFIINRRTVTHGFVPIQMATLFSLIFSYLSHWPYYLTDLLNFRLVGARLVARIKVRSSHSQWELSYPYKCRDAIARIS